MEQIIRLDWQALVKKTIARRKEQKLTQEQLAMLADVSKPTLNQFEAGKTSISVKNALKILSTLGLA